MGPDIWGAPPVLVWLEFSIFLLGKSDSSAGLVEIGLPLLGFALELGDRPCEGGYAHLLGCQLAGIFLHLSHGGRGGIGEVGHCRPFLRCSLGEVGECFLHPNKVVGYVAVLVCCLLALL